ncbi:pyridoxal phosphate-dependent aminotransferase [Neobacillus drentensis]|uniref:pyridoxal phosphate-dependent aminotransferase n=1 Tax=Neobacillus drentensis TaxID=220684 RepID=UPI002FFFDDCB
MNIAISNRISQIPFSSIRGIFEEAGRMEKNGARITHMEIGRPDFDTPVHIKSAASLALDKGYVHYTSNSGIPELREAIAGKLKRENGIIVDPHHEVVVSIGCKEAILDTIIAFINPGDEVLIPDPSWLEYQYMVELAGGVPVPVPLHEKKDFILDPNDVRDRITDRTKMIILNSPHNPTGTVLDGQVLRELAEISITNHLLVLSDEIYEKIIYDNEKHISIASLPGMFERTITINGFSKSYSMDGWRLGYEAGPSALIQPIMKVHQYNTTSATSFAQYGAVEAYNGTQEPVADMVKEFNHRRQLLVNRLLEIPNVSCVIPKGAFYVFPSFKHLGISSKELAMYLLKEAQIACVPGSAFGKNGEGYLRLAYSTDTKQINQAMDRLTELLKKIPKQG